MQPVHSLANKLALFGLLGLFATNTLAQDNPCKSFGVDFQDGGSYFQNQLSSDPFTFVQQFQGCAADNSQNILVDPQGDQVQCSDTPLLPDNTPEMSTCPLTKSQMISGPWSVVILSNNGNAAPIAYQRDFVLSVAPQNTTTFTPTATMSTTTTPMVNSTDVSSTTLPAATTTVPSTTIYPTKTMTPARVTVYTTKTINTITRIKPTLTVIKTTKVVTATCTVPPRQPTNDRKARIIPTIRGVTAAALSASSATASAAPSPNPARNRRGRGFIQNRARFLKERSERLAVMHAGAIVKRAPDQPVMTITDTNTADYPTITQTITAPELINTIINTVQTTTTITPPVVTVMSGQVIQVTTVTAPTPTRVITKQVLATVLVTKTYAFTVTITSTMTPTASVTACRNRGGKFF
ncbi:hypothetical protein EJ06DRAFT_521461 [Trichodelitschia bisporula]|uniref:Uncharacterized protein n=1 Tax=Trichodelitschia bisporula TaxID=703511 RepID=A0A6G1HY65_9PEZI|nr:hypothetical protein EJ06DRAFT_521461 [Trichodelitschia bisporula]